MESGANWIHVKQEMIRNVNDDLLRKIGWIIVDDPAIVCNGPNSVTVTNKFDFN